MRKQSTASAVSQNQPLHAETRARTTSDWSRKVPFKTFDDLISNIRSFTRGGVLYVALDLFDWAKRSSESQILG
jgi:hypothetical protein